MLRIFFFFVFFFFNDTATTEIYTVSDTLSLHDALPISRAEPDVDVLEEDVAQGVADDQARRDDRGADEQPRENDQDSGRSPPDVPRREAGQEGATGEDDGREDDPHEDREGRDVGDGHRFRTPGSPRRSGRSSSGGCDGPASSRSRRG